MNLMVVDTKTPTYGIEVNSGIGSYDYLIESRNNDHDNLVMLYSHLEALRLRECDIHGILVQQLMLNAKFHTCEDAVLNLDCLYWVKLLDNSKIKELMPYKEYSDLVTLFKTRNKENHIPFNKETVDSFINKIIDNKPLLFANKVNCVMQDLDWNYKNNRGSMLPPLLILKTSYSILPSWESCAKVDDLRYSICQIYGLDLNFDKTLDVLSGNQAGEWISVENDLLRIKRFKNANLHVLLSDVVYDKLNEIISLVNVNILSEDTKKLRKKTYKYNGE